MLKRSVPENMGLDQKNINRFVQAFVDDYEKDTHQELHSYMVIKNDCVVAEGYAEPFEKNMPHMMFSLSKSFTAMAVGLVIEDGLLTLEDKIVDYFENLKDINRHLEAATIRDFLIMSTGQLKDSFEDLDFTGEEDWIEKFFSVPFESAPGKKFVYNTGATYILSVICQKLVGKPIVDYLHERILRHMDMDKPFWVTCPRGYSAGGFGMKLTTEGIGKFGVLLLNQGMYKGKQLIPKHWVLEATSKQIDNDDVLDDWSSGYGYQFWRNRYNSYRGDGMYGQLCVVIPDKNMVVAITGALENIEKPLDHVWDYLLLNKDQAEERPKLELTKIEGQKTSSLEKSLNESTYILDSELWQHKRVIFECTEEIMTLKFGEEAFDISKSNWCNNTFSYGFPNKEITAVNGAWLDDWTFKVILRHLETPFRIFVLFKFEDDDLKIELEAVGSLMPRNIPTIKGKRLT